MFRPARQMKFSFLESSGETAVVDRRFTDLEGRLRGRDEDLSARCQVLLQELGLDDLGRRVVVEWNPRMRSCAGRAFWPQGLIQLNPRLAGISGEEVGGTLLHELAHLLAYERHPYRSIKCHGKEWRKACSDLGIPGEKATHELPLPSRSQRRRWKYECPGCRTSFERVRKYKGAVACYQCCGETTGGAFDPKFQLIETRLNHSPDRVP